MAFRKTVLIVEDNSANRKILKRILAGEYTIVEAENGREGLARLREQSDRVAAVVLDMVMPVMDGCAFLKELRRDAAFRSIPIIVSTSWGDGETEKRALQLGAWDFVRKPYEPEILKFRLKNAIERSRLALLHELRYLAEFDALTGIYSKAKFFDVTRAMLHASPTERFAFFRIDIERFQLVNSFYGTETGDSLLRFAAQKLRESVAAFGRGTYGRMEADVFAVCIPYTGEREAIALIERYKAELGRFELNFNLTPTCGIYVIRDKQEELSMMMDKAGLAAKRVKGNYIKNYAFYEEEMSRALEEEQEITNKMAQALSRGEFEIYFQPKYNLSTNRPEGAEALARWMDPLRGKTLPGVFIPIFERNGFVAHLDYYVWERVCALLRRWLDKGLNPSPISVNVSRVNIYTADLVERICSLTKKYDIPNRLLQLELTESAYTDNPKVIMETMKSLQEKGFLILMDDFGSGYSSLNVLKNMEVDIMKLDMKFLSDADVPGRGEKIISSVVRMAKWLGIPVIAEGAEKQEQVEFLREIGCEYVQGYYFARPMPEDEYEALIAQGEASRPPEEKRLDANEFLEFNPQMETLFFNAIQAVAIYEFSGDSLEIVRVNRAFQDLFGCGDLEQNRRDPLSPVRVEFRNHVLRTFRRVAATREAAECEYLRETAADRRLWISLKLKYVGPSGEKHILLGSLSDITAQKELDLELQKYRMIVRSNYSDSGKMLIVDDQQENRDILRMIFQERFTVLEAENGQKALEVLKENGNYVDIILLSLLTPVLDSTAFLRLKRASPELSDIPVIVIAAASTAERQVNMLALGANDYIFKPFVEEIVVRRVNNVLESNRRFREILREYDTVAKQAQTDPLTGICNRAVTEQLIGHILFSQKGRLHALLIMDIDNFKHVNDTYGHTSGDEVLSDLARRLTSFFRKEDVVGRFGGDEFCVFMTGVPSVELVLEKCRALCRLLASEPADGLPVPITVSVGAALSGPEANRFETLYQNADQALYDAKRQGKNRVAVYGQQPMALGIDVRFDHDFLVDELEAGVLVIDNESAEVLYANETARRLLPQSACRGSKWREALETLETPCVQAGEGRDAGGARNAPGPQRFLRRSKLVERNGRQVRLVMLVELPGEDADLRRDRTGGE